jgi:hypothetical protein
MSHLTEVDSRIEKALDAEYIFNMPQSLGGGGGQVIMLGQPAMRQPTSEASLPLETEPLEVKPIEEKPASDEVKQ